MTQKCSNCSTKSVVLKLVDTLLVEKLLHFWFRNYTQCSVLKTQKMQNTLLKIFKTYNTFWDLNIYNTSLSIILDKKLGFIWSGNVVFNVLVALDVLSRCVVDHGSTDSNLFLLAALLICMFKKQFFMKQNVPIID